MTEPLALPRLRQVAVVAADLAGTTRMLQETFGWPEPFHDPGVGKFGLANAVFAAGDSFIEVVTPVDTDTTAGRYLQRRGGDSGYMAIFQMPGLDQARHRVAAAGVRVVFTARGPGIEGLHLHPKDVPGAIVSLDWADPPESWHWAGPAWTGAAPAHPDDGVSGLTIEVADPAGTAARWAEVLGLTATTGEGRATIWLEHARQDLRFAPAASDRGEAITEVRLRTEPERPPVQIAGVRFISAAALPGGRPA
jgi:hypothetical protein